MKKVSLTVYLWADSPQKERWGNATRKLSFVPMILYPVAYPFPGYSSIGYHSLDHPNECQGNLEVCKHYIWDKWRNCSFWATPFQASQ
jgi:hypothetical protein